MSQDSIVAHGSAVPSGAVANRTRQPNTEPRRAGASPDRLFESVTESASLTRVLVSFG